MYRLAMFVLLVLLERGAEAACVRSDNQELIEYSCEGGTTDDLEKIPGNAEKIRITGMSVGRIEEKFFSRFTDGLLVLSCSHCQIRDIDDNAFRKLRALQQLSLDNNQLTEVRAAWFEGLDYLTYLDLNYNHIENIEPDVFRNTPELVDLRVSGNRLVCLDVEAMSRLRDLKRIFINENPNFGCPNALKKFLADRRIDFDADPQWNSVHYDRVRANDPLPPTTTTTTQEPTTIITTTTTSTASPTPQPRRPYVPEMIQPSVPEQDFAYQGPYYAPKVTHQQLDNYRNTVARNETTTTTTDEPTTTPCPNSGVRSLASIVLLLTVLPRWLL